MQAVSKCVRTLFLLFILLLFCRISEAQTIGITSPGSCVKADEIYSYTISGSNYTGTMSWTVVNGTFVDNPGSSTYSGTPLPTVKVKWNTAATGSLSVSWNSGTPARIDVVKYSSPLAYGSIRNDYPAISYNTAPPQITSIALATGGYCTPSYQYQWEMKPIGGNSYSVISGATDPNLTYTTPLTVSTYFRRKVTETNTGSSGYSNDALITVNPDPLISGVVDNPTQTIPYNKIPNTITVSPTSGGGCAVAWSYYWEYSTDNTNWSLVDNATSQNYTPGSLTQTTYFRRVAHCSYKLFDVSTVITITVAPQLIAGNISPSSQSITNNTRPGTITAGASTGGNCAGAYQYLWQQSSGSAGPYMDIPGATSLSYTPGVLTATTYYRLKTTCAANEDPVYTNNCLVSVASPLWAGSISTPAETITYGTAPVQINADLPAGGNCGSSYTYQWQQSVSGGAFTNIPGANAQNYQPAALTASTSFRRMVSCAANEQPVYTGAVLITVAPQLVAGSVTPATQTITYNTVPGQLAISGVSGGNCGTSYTYQWQQGAAIGGPFSDIIGATGATYTPGALTSNIYFRVKVGCASEAPAYTASVVVQVAAQLGAGSITSSAQSITYNTTPLQINASLASGGNCSGNYAYQWQQSVGGGAYTNIMGATSQNYQPGQLTSTTTYRRMVTCGVEPAAYTGTITVTVAALQPLNGGCINSADQTIASGAIPATIIATAATNGNCSASYSYQWQSSPDGVYFKDVPGATSANLNFSSGLTQTTFYQRRVTCGSELVYTGSIKVAVTGSASIRQMLKMDISQHYIWWVVKRNKYNASKT